MVYCMSDKLPNLNYNDLTGQDMGFTRPYSENTADIIDAEVKRIVNEQYERAKQILREHAAQHNKIRDLLIEKEVIYHDDVEKILGKRKWKSRTDEIIEINKKEEDPGTPPPFTKTLENYTDSKDSDSTEKVSENSDHKVEDSKASTPAESDSEDTGSKSEQN